MSNLAYFINQIISTYADEKDIEFELKLLIERTKHTNGRPSQYNKNQEQPQPEYTSQELIKIYKSIYNELSNAYTMTEIHMLNICNKTGTNKQFIYKNGIKIDESRHIYSKDILKVYHTEYANLLWKIKCCREHTLDSQADNKIIYHTLRYKRRYSFEYIPSWRIDFTFVMVLPYEAPASLIRETRELLFMAEDYRLFDVAHYIEIEIEYIGNIKDLSYNALNKALDNFPKINIKSAASRYDQAINVLHSMLSNKHFNNRRISINNLLPKPITLSKKQYYNMIAEQQYGHYYITHKLDGERTILFLNNDNCGYLTSSKWTDIVCSEKLKYNAILDCELYNGTFYIFDIIKFVLLDSHNYANIDAPQILDAPQIATTYTIDTYKVPFILRHKCMINYREVIETTKITDYKIKIKHFIKLSSLYELSLDTLTEMETDYPCDGIIFTSTREPYRTTQYFKWKPSEKMSIDFIAKECPRELLGMHPYKKIKGRTLYLLYVGIRYEMCKAFNLHQLSIYYKLFPRTAYDNNTRKDYFPIHFAPSADPLAYLFWSSNEHLDNKIIELSRINNEWYLEKIRDDKQIDYLNNQCFGNDYHTAESIWNTYINPFNYADLKKDVRHMAADFYFVNDDCNEFRAIRKFNNWVKNKLIESIGTGIKWAIDLCSGKGQDLIKYINVGVNNLICIDINPHNIDEIINRKYTYYKQGSFKKNNMSIYTICSDILNPNLSHNIYKYNPHCKFIVCNFGIHYICYTKQRTAEFAKLINSVLQSGGRFLCTYLDGSAIFNNIMNNEESNYSEWIFGKYQFKRHFISSTYTGINQKFSVKLPFDSDLRTEYLFNINILIDSFKGTKIDIDSTGSFAEFIDLYHHQMDMTNKLNIFGLNEDDLQYVNILKYTMFYKK